MFDMLDTIQVTGKPILLYGDSSVGTAVLPLLRSWCRLRDSSNVSLGRNAWSRAGMDLCNASAWCPCGALASTPGRVALLRAPSRMDRPPLQVLAVDSS